MTILLAILLSFIALIGTLFVGREVNRKIREFGPKENQAREEHSRSLQYEKSTFSRVRVYTLIYGITFLIAILSLVVYFSRL
ncbi:hypothetical protein GCM10011571_00910 [Marinithermofilum abyssi]|jgi:UDP-N-acetylmuramyl pentapeptide phosphotransferase/UDP-N-acetylglucosamine-1-phosphate transferase|uniref:Uncharacterized protein n=1 Tax=Marinithermofilum abyssi TaxID=1571185 RepID=A0A8J2YC34_9BACL|nr:hypothetical protein [Marinithermofilum abyssi]GGE03818.1 hypothetical protein GCM10011571_00910 [Marinithermofilum abyssi]